MRPFVTRYHLERLTGTRTEFYDGCEAPKYDGWTDEADDAFEFATVQKAQRRADRVGGDVFSHSRPATALEAAMMARPIHTVSRRRAA